MKSKRASECRPADTPSKKTITIEAKVGFLSQSATYSDADEHVEVKETHMSWVFLVGDLVYKMKKPVHYDFLDFSTLEARRRDCEREVRLNQRLAPNVYLDILALREQNGHFSINNDGTIVDWLVKMRRLPKTRMLENAITDHEVSSEDVMNVCHVLKNFYQHIAVRVNVEPEVYKQKFNRELKAIGTELSAIEYGVPVSQLTRVLDAQEHFISAQGHLLEQRAREGRIVDAHGDLRPEHICLLHEPVVIDCLEFNHELRILDPLDELAYLAMECERLGTPEIGTEILRYYCEVSGDNACESLVNFYRAFRACLRAKIVLWHLKDNKPQDDDKWRSRAAAYLRLAARYTGFL